MAAEKKNRQSAFATVIASLFTGIGGHYLNRRWDKAILFLCLFVLYLAAIYTLFIFMFWTLTPNPSGTMPDFTETKQLLSKAISLGFFALWLTSLIISVRDRKNNQTHHHRVDKIRNIRRPHHDISVFPFSCHRGRCRLFALQ